LRAKAAMSRARVREDVLLDQKVVAPMAHAEMEKIQADSALHEF
jgi:hypothetical protein